MSAKPIGASERPVVGKREVANDTQACFGFEMMSKERKAQMISFAYGRLIIHDSVPVVIQAKAAGSG